MTDPLRLIFLSLLAFGCGALPFSVWVGRWALGKDIRSVGDANPGATNVLRAGGRGWAAAALLLDMLKGSVPVGIAHFAVGVSGAALGLVAIMPVAGHAFSPLLGFRGGKAVATTGGIWIGLTVWEGPLVAGLLLGLGAWLVGADGWAVALTLLGLLIYFWLVPGWWNGAINRPDLVPTLLVAWLGSSAIVLWKHRADLSRPPRVRPSAAS